MATLVLRRFRLHQIEDEKLVSKQDVLVEIHRGKLEKGKDKKGGTARET